jgi:UDP-N-acetylmuramate--alanine ligase
LFEEIQRHGHKDVVYVESLETAVSHLKTILASNDILLTLGAGDVWKVGEMLLKEL